MPSTQELVTPNTGLISQAQERPLCRTTSWLGLIILGGVFAGMGFWSWRKWPDVFIDFGSQLYYPWQIATGRDLYGDLAYVGGGPLSQYYHAWLFQSFGTSMTTLVISSLGILGAMVLFIYEVFRRIADAWTATAVCLVILLFFAFSQYVWVGNYNFVCAYSYEAVHGLVLSLATVVLLSLWLAKGNPLYAAGAGFGLGLVFLTKPEIFLALALTLSLSLIMAFGRRFRFRPGFGIRSAIGFLAGALVPVLLCFLYFWKSFGFANALSATAGAWVTLLTTKAPKNAFYEWCLGLDHPWQNARSMLVWFTGYALGVLALAWCCCQFSRAKRLWERLILVLIVAGLVLWTVDLPWRNCGWTLPLTMLAIGSHLVRQWWKRRDESQSFQLLLPIVWSGFSLFLLSKMILHSRIWHYGFYLALPAMVMNVYYLNWWLPESLQRRGFHRGLFRLAICVVLGVGAYRMGVISNFFYANKTYAVGAAGDRIFTYRPEVRPHGEAITQATQWLKQNTSPNSTLAVLPEGLILNYLTRRPNPTRYASLTPLEVAAYGEATILKNYQAHTPDYIALIHRNSSEFGLGYFGQDPAYGATVMRWIRQNYEPVWLWGSEPLKNDQGGVRILKYRGASPQPRSSLP